MKKELEKILSKRLDKIFQDNKYKPKLITFFTGCDPTYETSLEILKEDESYDSAFSVCKYNMFSPTRARKIVDETIMPFVPLDIFPEVSSIRSSQGDVYFCDLSVQVIRARVFEDMWNGNLPFRWQGKKGYPLKNSYGFDIDEGWQKVAIEKWLKENWHEK